MSEALKYVNRQKQIIDCKFCGAKFDIHLQKCPYCGATNEYGDELEYQEQLDDIKEDLEDLEDASSDAYEEEIKTKSKGAIKVLIVVGILAIAGVIIFLTGSSIKAKRDEEIALERFMWERETFQKLDELYENGDLDGLFNAYQEFLESNDNDYHNMNNWKHGELLAANWEYGTMNNLAASTPADEDDERMRKELILWHALELRYGQWDKKLNSSKVVSQKDYDYIMGYVDRANEILHDNFGLDETRIEDIIHECLIDEDMYLLSRSKVDEIARELVWME